ncbi:MAG: cyclase family protein [Candidatus Zixiibacteriota bacterium]
MSRKIIDISHTLAPSIAVWPGDTEFRSFFVDEIKQGGPVNVGGVTMSLHCGTHADAPYHFIDDGDTIDKAELGVYIGPALVIDATGSETILERHVSQLSRGNVERLLFKTNSADPERFSEDFSHFTPEAARAIATLQVELVGLDTPSVDHPNSKTLESHRIFGEANIAILENLNLAEVEAGEYDLIALPLKISGMDGSPVRAVLLK